MPMQSKAQNRYFRWADEHPAEAAKRGLKPKVVQEFIQASHGEKVHDLPERATPRRKAQGGSVFPTPSEYPPKFRW